MDLATPETVLGDFSGTTLEHYGILSRMFRDGDRFMVNTEGPDGTMADFEVKYVFGVEPLQQYMVELERPSGSDENVILKPPRELSLEAALEYIEEDEVVEVTPESIRLRKVLLKESDRRRKSRSA